jgi:hypothetical protein
MDNRLWTQLKNQLDYVEVDDRSIVVSIDQLRSFLEINYVSLVNKVKSSGAEFLHKKVNSPYFLYMMCIDMENLQLVKFTLDYDKKFTRLIENDGNKVLKFDFKILTMTLKLSDMFEKEDLAIINPVLEKLKILEEGVPYARLKMIDLLDTLDEWIASEIDRDLEEDEPDPIPLITTIMDTIDAKSESDDPLTLLVTDY